MQATIAVTVPPAVLAFSGALQLGLLASFGALIVLYASDKTRLERAVKLPVVAVGFVVGAVVGIATGGTLIGSLAAICVIALAFSYLSLTFSLGPPGAIFPVLLTGTTGQLTTPASAGGHAMDPLLVVGVISAGIAWGYAVVVAPLVLPPLRRHDASRPHEYRRTYKFPANASHIFTRLTVAVLVSTITSYLLGLHHVAWVLLAVIGILQKDSDLHQGLIRIAQRIVGTGLGIAIASQFRLWMPEGYGLVLAIGLLVFGFVALLRRNLMLALMLVTPMALLLVAGGNKTELISSADVRVADTIVGGTVAALVMGAVALARHFMRRTATGI